MTCHDEQETKQEIMWYDAVPMYDSDSGWMLHVAHFDEDEEETVLVGPCGGVTFYGDELPTERSQHSWWMRYWRNVMETGDDPLNQIAYPSTRTTVDERWQYSFTESILGLIVFARKNGRGKWLRGNEIPADVRTFVDVEQDFYSDELPNPDRAIVCTDDARNVEQLRILDSTEMLAWGKKPPTSKGSGRHAWAWATIQRTHTRSLTDRQVKAVARKSYYQHKKSYDECVKRESNGVR